MTDKVFSGRNTDVPLTKRQRLRRVTLLCCHFVRNLAYHRAGRTSSGDYFLGPASPEQVGQFWVTVNGNFLDCSVLEWCKLFVDTKNRRPGEHRWDNVVADKVSFKAGLLDHIGDIDKDGEDFAYLKMVMSTYRDKFVAHLDEHNIGQIPDMEMANKSVKFYHQYIVYNEANPGDLAELPTNLDDYYLMCYQEAQKIYVL